MALRHRLATVLPFFEDQEEMLTTACIANIEDSLVNET